MSIRKLLFAMAIALLGFNTVITNAQSVKGGEERITIPTYEITDNPYRENPDRSTSIFIGEVENIYGMSPLPKSQSISSAVSVREELITIPTYEMNDDDPFPRFNQWKSDTPVYPYPMKNSGSWRKIDKKYIALVMENEYLKVVVLPEIGGHLYQFYDKVNKKDIIYTNHVIKPGYFAVRGGWVSGGFEFNFPQAHSTTTISPIDYFFRTNPDGSASIFIGNIERQYRMKWQVCLTLFPGKSFLQQDTKLYNRTPMPHRYHWWTIVATHANENVQLIFPAARVINNPQEYILTWPIWMGIDNSQYKMLSHRFGADLSMLQPWDGFFCYYDHGSQSGLVHVANKITMGGSKYFTYGNNTSGQFHSADVMSDDDGPYDEVDSSPLLTQKEFRILEPLETISFREYWYPANGTQGLCKATRDAALNLFREGEKIKLAINVNSPLFNGHVTVNTGGRTLFSDTLSVAPGQVYKRELPSAPGELSAILTTSDGEELLNFREPFIDESKLPPEGPVHKSEKEIRTMTVEELCLAGISELQRELPDKAVELFKAALGKDPGCLTAHNWLGIIYLGQGLWKLAQSEFEASLARERYQGIPHYYLGLIHRMLRNIPQALEHFWQSTRYPETYTRGHYCLGEIALAQNDPLEAVEHFQKSFSRNNEATETLGLMAIAYRTAKLFDKAKEVTDRIIQDEPLNHIGAFERYLLSEAMVKKDEEAFHSFLQLMRDDEHSYMELAWVYASCGLYDEAIDVLEIIAARKKELFPMLYYQLGYLYQLRGNLKKSAQFYKQGYSEKNWRYVFPNRLEEFAVLESALESQPEDFCARYALGNLLASRYRYEEAIREFRLALEKAKVSSKETQVQHRDVLTVANRNIGFLIWKTRGKLEEAIPYYHDALRYMDEHFLLYQELADLYRETRRIDEAIRVLESGLDKVIDPAELISQLAPLYMERNEFDKVIDIAPRYRYDAWKGLAIQRQVRQARFEKGKALFSKGDFEGAIRELDKTTALRPENIPVNNRLVREFSEILWYKGLAYSKLGKPDEAKKAWGEAELEMPDPISPLSFYKAKCLQAIGKDAEAETILDKMLFFGKMYATRYPLYGPGKNERLSAYIYLQALALEGKGMYQEAKALYEKVLELVPEHKMAAERLQQEALKK